VKKILIMGLPGSGKTTLARALAPKIGAVHWNADAVRAEINSHLGFSAQDRIEQARRMGWLCDQVVKAGHFAIADFVCPTKETREAFGDCITVWVNTIDKGRFEDTNKLFEPPSKYEYMVTEQNAGFWANYLAEDIDFHVKPTLLKAFFKGL